MQGWYNDTSFQSCVQSALVAGSGKVPGKGGRVSITETRGKLALLRRVNIKSLMSGFMRFHRVSYGFMSFTMFHH